jgi:hypothetical protein
VVGRRSEMRDSSAKHRIWDEPIGMPKLVGKPDKGSILSKEEIDKLFKVKKTSSTKKSVRFSGRVITKAGFTGKKRVTARGKKPYDMCYRNGVHVPCNHLTPGEAETKDKDKPAKKEKIDPNKIVSRIKDLLLRPNKITSNDTKSLKEQLLSLTIVQINSLKKILGVKATGNKAILAAKVAELALTPPKPEPVKPVKPIKPTVAEVGSKVKEILKGKVTPKQVKEVEDLLNKMTLADIGKIKTEFGVRASGNKAVLAKKVAELALKTSEVKPKKVVPPKKPKPLPDKLKLIVPVLEPEPTSVVEVSKVLAPQPPETNYTGKDTLGRSWEKGVLASDTIDPAVVDKPLLEINPKRALKLDELASGILNLTQGQLQDLAKFGLTPNNPWRMDLNDYDVSKDREAIKRLQDAGILEPISKYWKTGGQKLTDSGALSLALAGISSNELADPTTNKEIMPFIRLYGMSGNEHRGKILQHFGLDSSLSKSLDQSNFNKHLLESVSRYYNPIHVAQKVRDDKQVQELVTKLSAIKHNADDDPKMMSVRDRMGEIEKETSRLLNDRGIYLDMFDPASRIASLEHMISNPKATGKKKLKEALEKYKELNAEWVKLRDTKQGIRDNYRKNKYNQVSNIIRDSVKDPYEVKVRHGAGVDDDHKQEMGEALDALKGVIQKGLGNPPEYETYVNPSSTRAHCTSDNRINFHGPMNSSLVAIHEIMHGIESYNPDIASAIEEFRSYRVKDEKGQDLMQKFGGCFDPFEIGYKDNFDKGMEGESSAYYTGKYYNKNHTEILTMGVQSLYDNPEKFCRGDPEFATFIVGVLNGRVRSKPIPE